MRRLHFVRTANQWAGRIESGQFCTVVPIDPAVLEVGDIVLCKVASNEYLHIVKSIENGRDRIGNNRGSSTARIGPQHIYGKCVKIEPGAPAFGTLRKLCESVRSALMLTAAG